MSGDSFKVRYFELDTARDTTYNGLRRRKMSQFDKLLQRIRSLDKNLRFEELQKVLEHYGYTMNGPAGGSSHKTFRKPGKKPITIPQHDPIKRAYVEEVKAVVESEDESDENN